MSIQQVLTEHVQYKMYVQKFKGEAIAEILNEYQNIEHSKPAMAMQQMLPGHSQYKM